MEEKENYVWGEWTKTNVIWFHLLSLPPKMQWLLITCFCRFYCGLSWPDFIIFYLFCSSPYQIDRGSYGLLRKFLVKGTEHPHVRAYLNFMIDVAVIFGANRTTAESELHDALQFEIELAKVGIVDIFCKVKFFIRLRLLTWKKNCPLPTDSSGISIQSPYHWKTSNNISISELVWLHQMEFK